MMERYTLNELGKRIKAARKAKKKTQDDVAEAIGVSKISVSEWERGLKQPGFLNILNYCNFLGITIDELLGVKKQTFFYITFTEEERNMMLSMLSECQRDADNSLKNTPLHSKLHFLEQHIKAFFSRSQNK